MADPTKQNSAEGKVPDPAFPDIGNDEPSDAASNYLGDFKTREEAEAGWKATTSRIEQVEADLARATENFANSQATVDRFIAGGMAKPPAQPAPYQAPQPLPDPVADKDAYAKAVEAQVTGKVSESQQAAQKAAQKTARLTAVYDDFKNSPDYAHLTKDDIVTKHFAIEESAEFTKQGVDQGDGILADVPGFHKRVAKRIERHLKKKAEEAAAAGDGEDEIDDSVSAKPVSGSNRTAGIPGGGGGGGGKGKSTAPKKTFIEEMKEAQAATGFW